MICESKFWAFPTPTCSDYVCSFCWKILCRILRCQTWCCFQNCEKAADFSRSLWNFQRSSRRDLRAVMFHLVGVTERYKRRLKQVLSLLHLWARQTSNGLFLLKEQDPENIKRPPPSGSPHITRSTYNASVGWKLAGGEVEELSAPLKRSFPPFSPTSDGEPQWDLCVGAEKTHQTGRGWLASGAPTEIRAQPIKSRNSKQEESPVSPAHQSPHGFISNWAAASLCTAPADAWTRCSRDKTPPTVNARVSLGSSLLMKLKSENERRSDGRLAQHAREDGATLPPGLFHSQIQTLTGVIVAFSWE